MEIWLDTSNVNLIKNSNDLGLIYGVTTNPTILSLAELPPKKLFQSILEEQTGMVAVQVLSNETSEICRQARLLAALSPRVLVKIPTTQDGIRAIHLLTKEGIPTLATAIFELRQAFLAFKSGATYLAPYLGRMADLGKDPLKEIAQMQAMKNHYRFEGKIMAAGVRELTIALGCVELGICAITLPDKVFDGFIRDSEATKFALDKFLDDWSKSSHYQKGNNFYPLS